MQSLCSHTDIPCLKCRFTLEKARLIHFPLKIRFWKSVIVSLIYVAEIFNVFIFRLLIA